ncbi:DUF2062 domain-containing protein [Salidesulfovibrio onnuriiensis]|uniref:DUF2062 domain-containing protein n=1 Tax=Salidesulfovibrio onnuriiensis TaxID=2583823 RepID=UPI00202B2C8A|nr:DUF2062 domain-containing protein [Salidesulfovibrio onnuriiensis]
MPESKNGAQSALKRNSRELGWWERGKRASKYWYLRVMRQKSTPKELAFSLALGVFIGAMPIIPFQSVVVIALAFLFKVPKFAAWLATCYSNAFTMAPFYYFLYLVGVFFLPLDASFDPSKLDMVQMIEAGWQFFTVILAGGLIFGIPATILTYVVSLFAIRRFRRRRAMRMFRR